MRIRITFVKQGALCYTGHLDLHKLWERAARRAELPLAYSQGFHPQPKMNMAAALPLGFSSRCEIMDMKLEQDIPLNDLATRLNGTLPSGLQVVSVEQVDEREPALQTLVAAAEYEVILTEAVDGAELKRRVDSVIESESIPRERRGKTYDLRPLIETLELLRNDKILMQLTAREGATGRPEC
jgi:radical SAM-linked protein